MYLNICNQYLSVQSTKCKSLSFEAKKSILLELNTIENYVFNTRSGLQHLCSSTPKELFSGYSLALRQSSVSNHASQRRGHENFLICRFLPLSHPNGALPHRFCINLLLTCPYFPYAAQQSQSIQTPLEAEKEAAKIVQEARQCQFTKVKRMVESSSKHTSLQIASRS